MTPVGAASSSPAVDQAVLPANIRAASKERQDEYKQALAFERVLVGQMTESMMKTAGGTGETTAAVKAMKDQLPGMLADALTSSGGLGLARQMDAAMHPESQVTKTSLSGAAAPAPSTADESSSTTVAPTGTTGGLSA